MVGKEKYWRGQKGSERWPCGSCALQTGWHKDGAECVGQALAHKNAAASAWWRMCSTVRGEDGAMKTQMPERGLWVDGGYGLDVCKRHSREHDAKKLEREDTYHMRTQQSMQPVDKTKRGKQRACRTIDRLKAQRAIQVLFRMATLTGMMYMSRVAISMQTTDSIDGEEMEEKGKGLQAKLPASSDIQAGSRTQMSEILHVGPRKGVQKCENPLTDPPTPQLHQRLPCIHDTNDGTLTIMVKWPTNVHEEFKWIEKPLIYATAHDSSLVFGTNVGLTLTEGPYRSTTLMPDFEFAEEGSDGKAKYCIILESAYSQSTDDLAHRAKVYLTDSNIASILCLNFATSAFASPAIPPPAEAIASEMFAGGFVSPLGPLKFQGHTWVPLIKEITLTIYLKQCGDGTAAFKETWVAPSVLSISSFNNLTTCFEIITPVNGVVPKCVGEEIVRSLCKVTKAILGDKI
ncbi:hypothetical protein B0H10DRAFT_1961578 [Mycena sp. CBHHK59/15]|nr:hypothetical protein B0H10DRAFT_1961578 [Mycena sp. CBHHK59/15]